MECYLLIIGSCVTFVCWRGREKQVLPTLDMYALAQGQGYAIVLLPAFTAWHKSAPLSWSKGLFDQIVCIIRRSEIKT